MNKMASSAFLGIVVLVGLLVAGQAHAVIITGSGVDTSVRHFVIDGTASSVTHDPGLIFGGELIRTYAILGEFDASFSRYWWTYHLDGDANGTQGSFIFEQYWLTFSHPNLIWADDPGNFVFPNYFVRVDGANLVGDESACSSPLDPNTYCSGWINGPIASLTGTIENGRLSLQGGMPVIGGNLFENFVYDIQANAIPEPGILWLVLSALAGLPLAKRWRQLRSQATTGKALASATGRCGSISCLSVLPRAVLRRVAARVWPPAAAQSAR